MLHGNKINSVRIREFDLKFYDRVESDTIKIVAHEMNNKEYEIAFREDTFSEGEIVIDIGGNVGMFSIFLAKKFPFLKIYAFEPVFENWKNFKRNLVLNDISNKNIKLYNLAVTSHGDFVKLTTNLKNSGASSMVDELNANYNPHAIKTETVKSITLDEIMDKYEIKKCRLLKIDCEGAEFEILYNSKRLKDIEYIVGETHSFDNKNNNRQALIKYLGQYFPANKMHFSGF